MKNKEIINIVMASNDNYAQPLGVSLFSMLENFTDPEYQIKVTILDGGITQKNKLIINSIGTTFDTEIIFYNISNNDFKDFPLIKHYSIVTYYRLLIPSIFDQKAEKVLYLDSDILVLNNISQLYKTDIGNYLVAAVGDFSEDFILKLENPFYKDIKKYFNAGVLLLNVKKMNKENFVQKSFDFIKENSMELHYGDQDTLNYLAANNWLELDKKWNTQVEENSKKSTPLPYILHFITSSKPWHAYYQNDYHRHYMNYLKKAWPNYKITRAPIKKCLKHFIKQIPFALFIVNQIKKLTINQKSR